MPQIHPEEIIYQDGALGPSITRLRETGSESAGRLSDGRCHITAEAVVNYYTVILGSCAIDHQRSSFSIHGPHGMELGPPSPSPYGKAVGWGCACLGHCSEMLSREPCYTLTPAQGSTKRFEHVCNSW